MVAAEGATLTTQPTASAAGSATGASTGGTTQSGTQEQQCMDPQKKGQEGELTDCKPGCTYTIDTDGSLQAQGKPIANPKETDMAVVNCRVPQLGPSAGGSSEPSIYRYNCKKGIKLQSVCAPAGITAPLRPYYPPAETGATSASVPKGGATTAQTPTSAVAKTTGYSWNNLPTQQGTYAWSGVSGGVIDYTPGANGQPAKYEFWSYDNLNEASTLGGGGTTGGGSSLGARQNTQGWTPTWEAGATGPYESVPSTSPCPLGGGCEPEVDWGDPYAATPEAGQITPYQQTPSSGCTDEYCGESVSDATIKAVGTPAAPAVAPAAVAGGNQPPVYAQDPAGYGSYPSQLRGEPGGYGYQTPQPATTMPSCWSSQAWSQGNMMNPCSVGNPFNLVPDWHLFPSRGNGG